MPDLIRHLDICGAFVGFRVVVRNDGKFFEPLSQLRCQLPLQGRLEFVAHTLRFRVTARNECA